MKIRIVYGTRGKKHFYLDDREVTREEFDAAVPNRINDLLTKPDGERDVLAAHGTTCWPMHSDSAGVQVDQIAEATAHNKKMGDGVTYAPDGRAIFTSRRQRKEHLKNIGLRDKNAGFSD